MRKSIIYSSIALTFLIVSFLTINSAFAVMPAPTDKQIWIYTPIETPVLDDDPSKAKPVALGSVATGGSILSIQVGLNQISAPVDMYLAYTVSYDLNNVYVLNPDGATFTPFTIDEINNALLTGIPPEGAEPWKKNVVGPIDEHLFNMPVSEIPLGTYNIYFLVTPMGSLNSYYLWIMQPAIVLPSDSCIDVSGTWEQTTQGSVICEGQPISYSIGASLLPLLQGAELCTQEWEFELVDFCGTLKINSSVNVQGNIIRLTNYNLTYDWNCNNSWGHLEGKWSGEGTLSADNNTIDFILSGTSYVSGCDPTGCGDATCEYTSVEIIFTRLN